ncbi:GntR family transcriptional regulator [Pacificoceanicola onchidii]|uniref:GntR family transcriptional regulator n=1 Tax=Pacificoceanicola onchidii TaxID=2562685 RepID=UPI0010A675EA|nr:GntR family transcriptional regulator [Pacificoceanicola onchidii]
MNLQSMRRQDVPLHAEVAAVLRHQIKSGELPHGTKLPALRELTETLGVARMTVIQAMNTLEEEGLIERYSGRGTFVRDIPITSRHTLQMQADISQIYAMVAQLEVDVQDMQSEARIATIDGQEFRVMNRTHLKDGKPFCHVELRLNNAVFARAPDRFAREIAVSVLKDLGVSVSSAKQKITMSYANFELAEALGVRVNSAVFRVSREFFDPEGNLVYSALLIYPGDLLELEIDFTLPDAQG